MMARQMSERDRLVAALRGAVSDLDAMALRPGDLQPTDLDALARQVERVADEMAARNVSVAEVAS